MRCETLAGALALAAFGAFASTLTVAVDCDRTNWVCAVGERVTLTVAVKDEAGVLCPTGAVTAVLDNTGSAVIISNRFDLAQGNPFSVSGVLAEPGFLRLSVIAAAIANPTQYNKDRLVASVAVSPREFQQRHPCPQDFDAFWAKAKAKLAAEVPLDPQLAVDPAHADDPDFTWYHISFATFGRRVYGHYIVPKNVPAGTKLPAFVQVPGAGFGFWSNVAATRKGWITLFLSVFPWQLESDFEPNRRKYDALNDELRAQGLAIGTEKDTTCYHVAGLARSREDYFYYPVILGIDRAVDWLAARPEVDARRITYTGTSQGGAFGLILMGLNHRFARGVVYVPAMAGHQLHEQGLIDGWPRYQPSGWANAPYFDGVNFAARIRCPIRFAAGLADTVCPPTGVYAAFNACASPDKDIVYGIGMSHSVYGWIYQQLGDWECQVLGPR